MKKIFLTMAFLYAFTGIAQTNDYNYPAYINAVYDGDTVTATVYLGLGTYSLETIRLFGINAPEMKGSEKAQGTITRDSLRNKVLNKNVRLQTIEDKKGKYGRLLGIIYVDTLNVNQWLVKEKLAKEAEY